MSKENPTKSWSQSERLEALARYSILDTPQEEDFDDIARLAAQLLGMPMAAISLIDKNRQWFKAEVGIGVRETPICDSICAVAVLQQAGMVVPDTSKDPLFAQNSLVTGQFNLRFYAGELLVTPDGCPIGALCVLDTTPHSEGLTEQQRFVLKTLAQQVINQLELRRIVKEQKDMLERQKVIENELRAERNQSQRLMEGMDEGFIFLDRKFHIQQISAGGLRFEKRTASEIIGRSHWEVWPGSADLPLAQAYQQVMREQQPTNIEQRYVFPDGRSFWLDIRIFPADNGLAVFYRDITERKRVEALAYSQKKALELAVTEAPLNDIFEVLIKSAEEHTGARALVSLLLLDPDGKHLRHGAAPSLPEAYNQAIDGLAIGPAVCSCGAAAFSRQPVIAADIEHDPLWGSYRDLALAHGLRSCWSEPIISSQGKVLGTMASYHREVYEPTSNDRNAMALLVNTAALVIERRQEIHSRKAAEESLRRSEERFRSLVMASAQIVWTTDAQGRAVEDGPSWRAFTGQSFEEWTNSGWLNAVHPDDRERTLDIWTRSVKNRQIFDTQYRIRRVDGEYRWTAVRGVPVMNPDGTIREWIGTNTDINEAKRAEEALKASEERLHFALEAGSMVAWDWDITIGESIRSNTAHTLLSLGSGAAADFYTLIHPEDKERVLKGIERAKQGEIPYHFEFRVITPDGRTIWLTDRALLRTDPSNGHVHLTGVAVDITERKQAEERLSETASRLEFTLEAAQIGAWDLDLVNDTAHRSLRHDQCFGYQEGVADWGFEKFIQHVHPNDRQYVTQQFETSIAELKDWHFECRVVWPDQSIHWIAAHGTIYHIDTRPTKMSGIVFDITERKHAEEELLKAGRRKDEFLAMLAHELRNPLAPISAAADLLRISALDEVRVKQASEIISRQARHMSSLIEDLLDVSRVTRGLVKLDKGVVEARRVVSDAVEQTRPLIEARGHHLTVRTPPKSPLIFGDHKRLVQVIANVLNNAAKYTPEGGNIAISMEVEDKDILFSIEDTGIGMGPELIDRAFELFAQAERTADRSQGGLGIGLALVKSLVELHGGKVKAHSEGTGKGSKFMISLPRLEKSPEETEMPPAETTWGMSDQPLKIMAVDDNIDAAEMLAMFLETLGHQVFIEHDSIKALERAKIELPDVCVLDIGLPNMDGKELARRLQAQPETASALLIAVTGYGQEHDRKSALDAGFQHHLVKPVDTAKLAELLNELKKKYGK